jgi:hypothetical protein
LWLASVAGAKAKHKETADAITRREALVRKMRGEKERISLDDVGEYAGALILAHRKAYYVFEPTTQTYTGPWLDNILAAVIRDQLGHIDGVDEFKVTKTGRTLKSASELCHQYGGAVNNVIYYAKSPPKSWEPDTRTVYRKAYEWIDWEPIEHEIVTDLLTCMAGSKLSDLLAYLSKFRDLDVPLPALAFTGARGVWKSRVMEILGRCWTDAEVSHTNRARFALGKFNDCLLWNPTVWSEEQLFRTPQGKPQPELYRDSITSRVQMIEAKGIPVVTLKSCVRHLISVNNTSHLFSHEVDTDSIEATMERILSIEVDEEQVRGFERRWAGTDELNVLREGSSLLQHVRFIEESSEYKSAGRLFVAPKTDRHILLQSRFGDDLLNYLWQLAFAALESETRMTVKGKVDRTPLFIDEEGTLRLSPLRLHSLWVNSDAVAGANIRRPTPQKIGQLLTKAGFKRARNERATKTSSGGWAVDTSTLKDFIEISDITSWERVEKLCVDIFGRTPK